MSDYVAKLCQENSFLDNPLPEKEFVTALTAHFPREVERELRVSLIRTVPQLIEVLDEIDTAQIRTQQRSRARKGEYARPAYELHPRNNDRMSKRNDGEPPKQE